MVTGEQQSVVKPGLDLKQLEESLVKREEVLQNKRHKSSALSSDIVNAQLAAASQEVLQGKASDVYRTVSRTRQVLENAQTQGNQSPRSSREEYVNQLVAADDARKTMEVEIGEISSHIKELKERKVDAQKRLTVVRLMTMLDDLQILLKKKVQGPSGGEETRAQELLKTVQELSRERERTFHLLSKKEREMVALIDLKQRRIEGLRNEFTRNVNTYADSNSKEVLTVSQRIQVERNKLLQEIERLEETNRKVEDVLLNTKYTTKAAVHDRDVALPADEAMSVSANPEKESLKLRERIQKANAERRVYTLRAEEVQGRIKEETSKYQTQMAKLRKEIMFYQDESVRFERENKELKCLCDTLAGSLES